MEEAFLLESVRSGNTEAFAGIIERYELPITRYLYRLTGDWETARDLAQDTFIQAYKSILKTHFNASFKSWLYKTATHGAHRYFRKYRPHLTVSAEAVNAGATLADGDNHGGSAIENLIIREALLGVDKEQRTCLLLHFWEGFKYREIAGITGISEEAVRKRVARGCREFRKRYQMTTGEEK